MGKHYTLPRNDDGTLVHYAFPGAYTIFYLTGDNSCLCADCANKQESDNRIAIGQALFNNIIEDYEDMLLGFTEKRPSWHYTNILDKSDVIIGADCNYEDCTLYCDECSQRIEPSYFTDEDCAQQADCSDCD